MNNINTYKKTAINSLKGNWSEAILVCFIVLIIDAFLTATKVGALVTVLIMGPLEVALISYFIKLINNKNPKVRNMFDDFFPNLFTNFFTSLLLSLYVVLWALLFVIPGIIKSFSYAMTMFIKAKKPDMDANKAITLSRNMMNGNKWKLFCLSLSFMGWILLSIITLGVGFVFLTPYMNATKIAFFEDIYNNYISNNSKDVHIEVEKPDDNYN